MKLPKSPVEWLDALAKMSRDPEGFYVHRIGVGRTVVAIAISNSMKPVLAFTKHAHDQPLGTTPEFEVENDVTNTHIIEFPDIEHAVDAWAAILKRADEEKGPMVARMNGWVAEVQEFHRRDNTKVKEILERWNSKFAKNIEEGEQK